MMLLHLVFLCSLIQLHIAYADSVIPLIRTSQGRKTQEETAAWAARQGSLLASKYNGNAPGSKIKKRNVGHLASRYNGDAPAGSRSKFMKRDTGTNEIVNHNQDSSYFGSLAIGTPPVAFNVILDTGSADMWVASSSCTIGCQGVPTFNAGKSTTFKNASQSFSIQYGSGSAQGFLGSDTVQMAGFSVPEQTFAVVNDVSANLLANPVSGLLGMAFQSIATSHAIPLWQAMVESNIWTEPQFAFYITRFINASHAQTLEPGGRLSLGFADPSLYTGEIEYTSIPEGQEGYWILPMTSLTVNNQSIDIGSTAESSYSAVDTGTTLIGGPPAVIKSIFSTIPGSAPATGDYAGYYTFPCSTPVRVSLSFGGGTTWSIDPEDFVLAQLGPTTCLGAFFSLNMGSNSPTWIIGDTFLKNVYSVFRYNPPSVGFAQLSLSALDLAVAGGPIPSATIGANPAIASDLSSASQLVAPSLAFLLITAMLSLSL